MAADEESPLGAFIRSQREMHDMTVRQLAQLAGISNPYLSQIERGLREPSERVLDAIAQQLELSADAMKAHGARHGRDDDGEEPAVVVAIRQDPRLTARQQRALLEVYAAFSGYAPRRRR
jgi:transcriptional regulator with XRE-family HTH domain